MGNPHHIKADIENVEKLIKEGTRKEYKQDNLIILAGQRLQLGISLRNVDIVTLWNSISSTDAIFQMLFRSMTEIDVPSCKEKPNEYCDEKRFGFMVDMNPQRALTNVSLFSANMSKKKDDADVQNNSRFHTFNPPYDGIHQIEIIFYFTAMEAPRRFSHVPEEPISVLSCRQYMSTAKQNCFH